MADIDGPKPKPGVMDIDIYVPGKSAAPQGVKLHKLSSNETPVGASPLAQDAILKRAELLELYPDGSSSELKQAISEVHGLNPDNLICGNGSDEILSLIGAAFLCADDEVIYSAHGFLMYRIIALTNSAKPVAVSERNETADVDGILKAITDRTRLVFLANPNNPTGTYLSISEIRRLHAGLPDYVILVLDAAYAEYVRRNDYEAGFELVAQSNNVIMTRTFSKIYGLAALRIGWAYGPRKIIETLERIRGPFNVNALAIAAGAAAIRDRAHTDKAVEHNSKWLPWLSQELERLGIRVTPSVGNFILIHFSDEATARNADQFLTNRGLILRMVGGYGFPCAMRMTVGSEEANRLVVDALREFLSGGAN